jgi:hypothetical protein
MSDVSTATLDALTVPWDGLSTRGTPIRVTRECNPYSGAAPYYAVAYNVRVDARGRERVQAIRYMPSWERAQELLGHFLRDVTDPAWLRPARASRSLSTVTKPPGNGSSAGTPELALASPEESRVSRDSFVTSGRVGGRPRMHVSPAARQRAYRDRRRAVVGAATVSVLNSNPTRHG